MRFHPATAPSADLIERIAQTLRRRILTGALKIGAIPEETARELLIREHGGFLRALFLSRVPRRLLRRGALDASVRVEAEERDALWRLLSYCTRPALATNRLQYLPDQGLVRYRPIKGKDQVLQWTPLEFLERFAPIIPPPYLNLVRYAGALGPRSRLRQAVCAAAQTPAPGVELLRGWNPPVLPPRIKAIGRKLASLAARAWALCLARVFEVYPLLCSTCGVEMRPVAAITSDSELTRLLNHLGLRADFPTNKPARSPPLPLGPQDSQIDPSIDRWDGIDPQGAGDWTSA